MDATSGNTKRNLIRALKDDPSAFDFFEVARRVDCLSPQMPRTGWGDRVRDEVLRFAEEPSLAFSPNALATFQEGGAHGLRLGVNFLGLLGANGPMPLHFTEYVRDRSHNNLDPTWQRFLDIFHHRAISLFFRAWSVSEMAISHDRADDDWLTTCLECLAGVVGSDSGDPAVRAAKLHWAGTKVHNTRFASGLEATLSNFFEVEAGVHQFVGSWLPIPGQCHCRCGRPGGATLGVDSFLGAAYHSITEKFRIVFGPLTLAQFERLLPGGRSFQRLEELVESYLDRPLAWEFRMVIKKEQVPDTALGQYGRLGYTTWLKSGDIPEDDDGFRVENGRGINYDD